MSNLLGMPALQGSQLHTLAMSPMHSALDATATSNGSYPLLFRTFFQTVGSASDLLYRAFGYLPWTAIPSTITNTTAPIDPALRIYTRDDDVFTPGSGQYLWPSYAYWEQIPQGVFSETAGGTWTLFGTTHDRSTAQVGNPLFPTGTWDVDSFNDSVWSGHLDGTVDPGDNLTRTLSGQWSAIGLFNAMLAGFYGQSWTPDWVASTVMPVIYNLHEPAWGGSDTSVATVDNPTANPTDSRWASLGYVSAYGWLNAGPVSNIGYMCNAMSGWCVLMNQQNSSMQNDYNGYNISAIRMASYHTNPDPQYYFIAKLKFVGNYATVNLLAPQLSGPDHGVPAMPVAVPDSIEFVSDGLLATNQWLGNVQNTGAIQIGSETIPTSGLEANGTGTLRNCVLHVGVIGQNPNTWAAQFGLEMTYPEGVAWRV